MKVNYAEYTSKAPIVLSCQELSDMFESLKLSNEIDIFKAIAGIYKYGFERGIRCEKNRRKRQMKK